MEMMNNHLHFFHENISGKYSGRGTFTSIMFPFLSVNTISVFILIISISSSISSVIVLNIILLKFKQGIVEIPFRYLWRISVLVEHCGYAQLALWRYQKIRQCGVACVGIL